LRGLGVNIEGFNIKPIEDGALLSNGTIAPLSSKDDVFAAQPGGFIDQLIRGGGGGMVNNFYMTTQDPNATARQIQSRLEIQQRGKMGGAR
jgi:hypothetical protein